MKLSLRLSRSFVVDLNKWPAFCNRLNQESSAERLRLVTTPRHPNVTLFGVWNSGEREESCWLRGLAWGKGPSRSHKFWWGK